MAINRAQIKLLKKLIRMGSSDRVGKFIDRLHSTDLGEVFPELNINEIKTLVNILFSVNRAARTLRELPKEFLADILDDLDESIVAGIVERLAPDDAVLFIELLEEEKKNKIIDQLSDTRREQIEQHLTYPPDSAGSVMTTEFFSLPGDLTAQDAIEQVRRLGDKFESIFYLYVTDDQKHLLGVVPIRRLVVGGPDRPLKEIMISDPANIEVNADREQAAELIARFNLLAIPVVDESHRLLGIITVDDVIDIIQEEATEDMYRIAGLSAKDRIFSPIQRSIWNRLPWMVVNLFTVFLSAYVIGLFEDSIDKVAALAIFMPIVAAMGGNAGTQTLTVVTRGIALGELKFSSAYQIVFKQVGIGLVIGAITGLLTTGIVILWRGNPYLGMILFAALIVNMGVAGLAGAAIPLLLRAIGQDPAMGGSIFTITLTDFFGFLTFLGLATVFIKYLV